jgi:hypothetical protein
LLLNINRCGFLEEVGDHGSSHDLPSAPPLAALLSSFLKCDSSWSKPEFLWSLTWVERDSESLRLTGKLVSMKWQPTRWPAGSGPPQFRQTHWSVKWQTIVINYLWVNAKMKIV